jgi:uncharacterized RDD family membrane protein YckC
MHLEDRMRIDTPEGVSIEVTLAGLGSRFGAALVDLIIQGVLLLALTLALSLAGSVVSGDLGVFPPGHRHPSHRRDRDRLLRGVRGSQRRANTGEGGDGISVATVDGTALSLGAVTLRTLMRLVDFLPAFYAAGALAIAVTPRNQRLGDLVANTIVIRHRIPATAAGTPTPARHLFGVGTCRRSPRPRWL